jgi:hypothetical protein
MGISQQESSAAFDRYASAQSQRRLVPGGDDQISGRKHLGTYLLGRLANRISAAAVITLMAGFSRQLTTRIRTSLGGRGKPAPILP